MTDKDEQAAEDFERRWKIMVPTYSGQQRLRDQLYGIRVEDDPHPQHAGGFGVVCPEHGSIGDDLTIVQARELCATHQEQHAPAV